MPTFAPALELKGDLVLARNPLFQLMHSEESTDVAGNIRELAQGEFTIATPSRITVAAKAG